jgi:uncharacterized NAD(P)/FAD-binding protein YdhS
MNGKSPLVTVHVIEPGTPGPGVFAVDEPDYLALNTPCGQHSMSPYPDQPALAGSNGGFFEWVQARGYRWVGDRCRIDRSGREIGPHDFLPRRLMGEYLAWFYATLVEDAPRSVRVVHHRTGAVDVAPTTGGGEQVRLADGTALDVDHVILTTGHTIDRTASGPRGDSVLKPYPVTSYVDEVGEGELVTVAGLGLVALDVIIALTVGRGGSFVGEGRLRYRPSGREPVLSLFSRSGYPYCAKSIGTHDPTGEYVPFICTPERVATLRAGGSDGASAGIDVRRDLLPLVFGEMQARYYTQSARIRHGAPAEAETRQCLARSWEAGCFSAALERCAERYGDFDVERHFFAGRDERFLSSKDYENQVYTAVESDLAEAMVPAGMSPVKAAYEVLRVLRDTMRAAVEFRGLTLDSYVDFQANIRTRVTRMVAGPPAFRSQQLLALMDAGVVRVPFGPSPSVRREGGRFVVSSEHLARPYAECADRLIEGHLDDPSLTHSGSPLLQSLGRRGRLRPLHYGGTPVGSVDLSEDFHPVNEAGDAESRLWVLGALTEGVRYFTHYIPSPKSRIRAFVDAEVCAEQILGAAS